MALCQLAKEQAGLAGQLANWSLLLAKRPDLSHGIGYALFRPLILSALQLQRIFVVFILVAKLEEKTCFGLLFYDGFFNEALIRTLYSTRRKCKISLIPPEQQFRGTGTFRFGKFKYDFEFWL